MKSLLSLILCIIAHGALAQSVELHVMLNGTQQDVNDDELVAALKEMVESSSVDTTKYVDPADKWGDALAAPIFVHALFDKPRQMKVRKESDTTETSLSAVHEILIVIHGSGQIFLKTDDGVRSLAKYSPCALERVITVAKLETVAKVEYLRKYCGRS